MRTCQIRPCCVCQKRLSTRACRTARACFARHRTRSKRSCFAAQHPLTFMHSPLHPCQAPAPPCMTPESNSLPGLPLPSKCSGMHGAREQQPTRVATAEQLLRHTWRQRATVYPVCHCRAIAPLHAWRQIGQGSPDWPVPRPSRPPRRPRAPAAPPRAAPCGSAH